MFASRILNPFILPLFATFEDKHRQNTSEIYFISPHCENGDLYQVLEKCRENPPKFSLNQTQILRIILQVAQAILYLHTPVLNFRKPILHKDICSSNIVLDKCLNSRLIDFGLARTVDDTTTTASGKIYYLHPDVGIKGKSASVIWDFYSFGVVIRELLTHLPPSGNNEKFLKHFNPEEVEKHLADIWSINEDSTCCAAKINAIATKCLNSREGLFDLQKHVVDEVKTVFKESVMEANNTQESKCMSCMINPAFSEAPKRIQHARICKHKHSIAVCIACERNSFLNPLSCYGCGAQLYPVIGHEWGALLLAGNDLEDDSYAQVLKDDVERVRKVLVSRAPMIVGIRQEHVRSVTLSKPGKQGANERLLPELEEAVKGINNTSVNTLVVYFSCHGGKSGENYFLLASAEEKLTLTKLQELLMSLQKVKKMIIFFDRCYAAKFVFEGKEVVQINACKENETVPVLKDGSPFTDYLIKGLKAKSEGGRCDKQKDRCKTCEHYWETREDYVTVGCLLRFVAEHMKSKGYPEPYCLFEGDVNALKLAYYSDEEVLIDFTEDGEGKLIPIELCQDMGQLESQLLSSFNKESDMTVTIQSDTYQKEQRYEDCKEIAELMMAWSLRKPLHVKFKKPSVSN